MPKYSYQAKNADGKLIRGTIDSTDESSAINELGNQGLLVSSLEEVTGGALDAEISFFSGVSAETMSTFLLQLSIMIKCGVNLAEALQSLEHGEENVTFKKILGEVRAKVYGGQSFSEALAAHPDVFDRFLVAMIRVGETGGVLEQVLAKLSSSSKRQMALRNQILGALAYPAVLFSVAGVVLLILMGFAVPRFAELFLKAGIELPITTRILITVSDFVSGNLYQVIAGVFLLIVVFVASLFTNEGRKTVGELALQMPIMHPVMQRYYVVQIAEAMSLLLAAGVPLRELLLAIEGTMTLPTPKAVVSRMREFIDQGGSLKQALEDGPIFPTMAVKLIETGEVTGSLDSMFGEVASYYDDQLQTAIKSALSMLEPILIAMMAVVVGFIMLSIFIPLFKMSFIKPK
ncbi:MAG TPA: type II secretion system F family protein [Candidatus Rifleibacterium sp.]|nr:type II secretion system F family protein [Candidatus Rifleibacterium sp.]